ncbi:MAG: prephenate dehydrogenase/arogenate dehydrogenase family protein [Alicyclobacillus sp.]|nr:prephenate dehydrogenase/arogenate dehydrogenase family protein [Alicyclobacillus sp.]
MWVSTETGQPAWPQTVLVIGCGLLGTSIALALKNAHSNVEIDGIEASPANLKGALARGPFRRVESRLSDLPSCDGCYDLAILAVPVDTAVELLPEVHNLATIVMDVCSVKQDVCTRAEHVGMKETFAPTHPMAGRAAGGPEAADASLFEGNVWILVRGWPACARLVPMLQELGSTVAWVEDAAEHDKAMAVVSHGIHLTSLSAMLAYQDATACSHGTWAALTGPGFRDITRLSASPPDFWTSTLLANRTAVLEQLERIIHRLQAFESTLAADDAVQLKVLLSEARAAHQDWAEAREAQLRKGKSSQGACEQVRE